MTKTFKRTVCAAAAGLCVGLYLVAGAGLVAQALAAPAKPAPDAGTEVLWLTPPTDPEAVAAIAPRPPDSLLIEKLRNQLRIERARHSARVGKLIRALRKARAANTYQGPHLNEWTCIATHESGDGQGTINWHINTGNGYYGGLQMDRQFQATYAPHLYATKGTADRWTPAEQMRAADRAVMTRGFNPWPNTARACGLL